MATTTWTIDTTHSEVQFKVKHMMISTVTGYFSSFNCTVTTEGDDFTSAKVEFTADLSSISTNNEQRDTHLKSEDFFDAANHPQVHFKGGKLEKQSDDKYTLHGDLTIRGTTKPVVLDVEFGGIAEDPWGNTRAGFTVDGRINRKDYGLHWSAVTEAGGIVVSDEVRLHVNAEFIRQAAQ
ncbi:MAG: polyisoprenoid-binding protein [Sphingobacteriales bacterium]|nr:MAG: polyisoprenoid-binding protein [Sphingobacteriales bacterium]